MGASEVSNRPAPYAKRSLGQNFLQDKGVARRIVEALGAGESDEVIEIGPGRGALTEHLVDLPLSGLRVIEKDDELAQALSERWPAVEVVGRDAMAFAWESLTHPVKLIGNLPYNIASPLIWEIVSRCPGYTAAVFMIQFEVAQRLAAPAGSRLYGGLSVWVQSFARVKLLFKVGPGVFRPRPKVDSAVIRLEPVSGEERLFDPRSLSLVIKLLFGKRRKQIGGILRPWWSDEVDKFFDDNALATSLRPEELSPGLMQKLSGVLGSRIPS